MEDVFGCLQIALDHHPPPPPNPPAHPFSAWEQPVWKHSSLKYQEFADPFYRYVGWEGNDWDPFSVNWLACAAPAG